MYQNKLISSGGFSNCVHFGKYETDGTHFDFLCTCTYVKCKMLDTLDWPFFYLYSIKPGFKSICIYSIFSSGSIYFESIDCKYVQLSDGDYLYGWIFIVHFYIGILCSCHSVLNWFHISLKDMKIFLSNCKSDSRQCII